MPAAASWEWEQRIKVGCPVTGDHLMTIPLPPDPYCVSGTVTVTTVAQCHCSNWSTYHQLIMFIVMARSTLVKNDLVF